MGASVKVAILSFFLDLHRNPTTQKSALTESALLALSLHKSENSVSKSLLYFLGSKIWVIIFAKATLF